MLPPRSKSRCVFGGLKATLPHKSVSWRVFGGLKATLPHKSKRRRDGHFGAKGEAGSLGDHLRQQQRQCGRERRNLQEEEDAAGAGGVVD